LRRRGVEQFSEGASCADQSALLRSLLGALMDQREHLIAGDVRALHRANTRLSELLEAQTALGDGTWRPGPGVEAAELAELLSLAARVSAENAINHMLAVRGLQFTGLSFELLGQEASSCPTHHLPSSEPGEEGGRACSPGAYSLRLLDTRG